MNTLQAPSKNSQLLISPVADGYVVYDIEQNVFHELNATAALLLELCDGKRTVKEVIDVAADVLPEGSVDAVHEWILQAADASLIVEADRSSGATAESMTPDQLSDVADRLREEGKVQAAYRCQEHAAAMRPDDAALQRDLGELAHIVGKRDEAREAYERYVQLVPDDAEIGHLLTALRNETPPTRVPNECIQQLYERFASFYESNMCEELGYEGPRHLGEVVAETLGDQRDLNVLDLGCGTGLAGMMIKDRAKRLVGIDLSADMIQHAKSRNLYDELHVAEVTQWLTESDETFDLILACDTFIYFGDLSPVLTLAEAKLAPGGHIAFSVERADSGPFHLTDNGRYVHHHSHLKQAAAAAGLAIVSQKQAFLRMEYGQEVDGLFSSLERFSS